MQRIMCLNTYGIQTFRRSIVCVKVNCKVKPECFEQFKNGCQANSDMTNKEEGCVAFKYSINPKNQNNITLIEAYRNEDALNSHRSSKHFAAFDQIAKTCLSEPRTKEQYDRVTSDFVDDLLKKYK
ncbi:hypothetical protein WA158_001201 [Blastocystis sp. Blastoise]